MPAKLEIREFPNALSFRVTETARLSHLLISAIAGVGGAIFFIYASSSLLLKIFVGGLCSLLALKDVIAHSRGTNVELFVDNLDFKSTGHAPGGYQQSIISRADVYNMEFRKSSGGGDEAEQPQGLYVERHGSIWNTGTCVIPAIDTNQADQVIEAILKRFPDTYILSPESKREPYLTTLNLNK